MDECPPVLTKIIATVGTPGTASASVEMLTRLVEAGATVFRLNFSHGRLDQHLETLRMIRDVEYKSARSIGVLGDLSGPKIRIGQVVEDGVRVESGQDVILQKDDIVADGLRFNTTAPEIIDDIDVGQKVLINDGAIRMLVVDRDPAGSSVTCRVTTGGLITSRKGINLPNTKLSLEAITEKDWQCVEWAVKHELDFLALSFVRQAEEVERLRSRVREMCQDTGRRPIPIVSKIEKPEAIANIHGILHASDAVMIARGDLGVEMDLAEVPVIQKQLVDLARKYSRPTIVATQMLESMLNNPTPTRAEASDVANAILDNAGCLMLSGETAIGSYPALAVETMRRIAERTEPFVIKRPDGRPDDHCRMRVGHWTDVLAAGARRVVEDVGAKLIVAWSQSGRAAMYLSETRFPVPILACSDEIETVRRVTLLRGVIPHLRKRPEDLATFTREMDEFIRSKNWAERGEPILFVAGHPIGIGGATDSLAVHYLGYPDRAKRPIAANPDPGEGA